MQKNLYFRTVLRRRNVLLDALLGFFMSVASYPRLFLEVFIRKNFGDRYFSIASVVTILAYFLFVPYLLTNWSGNYYTRRTLWEIISGAPSIYIFLCLFLVVSVGHYIQVKQGPSVFDFEKFSLSSGDINPLFYKIQLFGKKPSHRLIETIYEPLLFGIIGWVLTRMDLALGYIFIVCAIFYSLSYVAAYKQGDDFVKDKIDEMIMNGEMENAFVGDEDNNKRGVRFRADKPSSRKMREDLADEFVVEERETAEAI